MQRVPVLRRHSVRIQFLPLKKLMVFRVGQIHKHNRHRTRVETALSSQGPIGKNYSEVITHQWWIYATQRFNFVNRMHILVILLVKKTNRYCHSCVDSIDDEFSPQPDVTKGGLFVLLAIAVKMEHC
jgi:hypothetical protein